MYTGPIQSSNIFPLFFLSMVVVTYMKRKRIMYFSNYLKAFATSVRLRNNFKKNIIDYLRVFFSFFFPLTSRKQTIFFTISCDNLAVFHHNLLRIFSNHFRTRGLPMTSTQYLSTDLDSIKRIQSTRLVVIIILFLHFIFDR